MKNIRKGFTILELVMVIAISVTFVAFAVVMSVTGIQIGFEQTDISQIEKLNKFIFDRNEKSEELINNVDMFYTFILTNNISSELLLVHRMNRKYIFNIKRQVVAYTNTNCTVYYPNTMSNVTLDDEFSFEVSKSLYEKWLAI